MRPRLIKLVSAPGLNSTEVRVKGRSYPGRCCWALCEDPPKQSVVCLLCKMPPLLHPTGIFVGLGISVHISPILGKILGSRCQPSRSVGLVASSIFPKPQQKLPDLIFNENVENSIREPSSSNQPNQFPCPTSLGGMAQELVGLDAFKGGI